MSGNPNISSKLGEILEHHKESDLVRRLESKLGKENHARLKTAIARLDKHFLEEQAGLIRDMTLDLLGRRGKGSSDILMQRSVWASLDGIALHLDETGFTTAFRPAAAALFREIRLDDPAIVKLETQLIHAFAGIGEGTAKKIGLGAADLASAMALAEINKAGEFGLKYIANAKFNFRTAMTNACGRPDKLLEVHAAIGKWVPVVTFIANIIVLIVPVAGVPISIATIVAGVILALVAGC